MFFYQKGLSCFYQNTGQHISQNQKDVIWDLDGIKYFDFSLMGVGTNILGYSNKKIDSEVKKIIDKGNMSTLNSYEEVRLSKAILKIHKWAKMVKFARSGGEANSIAVRIARASTKKANRSMWVSRLA